MKASIASADMGQAAPRSFRAYLQAELAERCARNRQYSLRAFALDLKTDHSTLSQILRGKRAVSAATIERYGEALRMPAAEVAAFVKREQLVPGPLDPTLLEIQTLTAYTAHVVTDWEHFAILELTRLRAFRPDVAWIARVLGITPDAVVLAVNRLLYLGLLAMDGPAWHDTSGDTIAELGRFTRATIERLFQRVGEVHSSEGPAGILNAAPQEHSATTLAVDSARVAEVLRRIRVFQRELVTLLHSDEADAVYRLDIRLYPVTDLPGVHR